VSTQAPGLAPTSGPAGYHADYQFADGDLVEAVVLPYDPSSPAPFQMARWSVAPGKASDLDVHESREVWLVVAGQGELVWADRSATIGAGDVIAFDSKVPHQVRNRDTQPLRVFSVYWAQTAARQATPPA
jgi:mannose-6-phosphate isomerase-like protein (cupin superfamily)